MMLQDGYRQWVVGLQLALELMFNSDGPVQSRKVLFASNFSSFLHPESWSLLYVYQTVPRFLLEGVSLAPT